VLTATDQPLPAAVIIRVATVTIGVTAVAIRIATVTIRVPAVTIRVAVVIGVPAVTIRIAAVSISAVNAVVARVAAVTISAVTISAVTITAVAATVVLGIRRAGSEHEQREDAKNPFHPSLLEAATHPQARHLRIGAVDLAQAIRRLSASSNMKPCPSAGALKSGSRMVAHRAISIGTTYRVAA
jgi:hypothetical protein